MIQQPKHGLHKKMFSVIAKLNQEVTLKLINLHKIKEI